MRIAQWEVNLCAKRYILAAKECSMSSTVEEIAAVFVLIGVANVLYVFHLHSQLVEAIQKEFPNKAELLFGTHEVKEVTDRMRKKAFDFVTNEIKTGSITDGTHTFLLLKKITRARILHFTLFVGLVAYVITSTYIKNVL